jgi:hypothetical protein
MLVSCGETFPWSKPARTGWLRAAEFVSLFQGRRSGVQETAQQYTRRILGYIEGKKPLEILAATPRQISRLVKGVSRKKLSERPAPDKWSVTEILAHLADSELVYGFRIRLMFAASGTAIQNTDQDAWAKSSDYAGHDPSLSLEGLRITRERTVRLLKSMPRASWDCYGIHSERGKETVTRVVEMLAGHDINHMMQIRERLSKK